MSCEIANVKADKGLFVPSEALLESGKTRSHQPKIDIESGKERSHGPKIAIESGKDRKHAPVAKLESGKDRKHVAAPQLEEDNVSYHGWVSSNSREIGLSIRHNLVRIHVFLDGLATTSRITILN